MLLLRCKLAPSSEVIAMPATLYICLSPSYETYCSLVLSHFLLTVLLWSPEQPSIFDFSNL